MKYERLDSALRVITVTLALLVLGGFASAQPQPPEGFAALFSGRDLEGWNGGEVKSPETFQNMSYQQWYDYRRRMLDGVHKHWRVEGGELIGTGGGPDLVTWKRYGDFEMWVDWKVTTDAEAGIGLRYGVPVRLWDAEPSSVGSGGLSKNQSNDSEPARRADKPTGHWNRMYIRMVGPYVKIVLNGKLVVDDVVLENIFDRDRPIPRKGPIHLQSHEGEVRYRNLFIRELSSEQSNQRLDEIAGDDGRYTTLFNGKDLDGWAGALQGYEVVDGVLRGKRKDGGNIQTIEQYDDFIVRFEFKLPPAGNNGLLIRTPNTNPTHTPDTLELQILDDHHIMHRQLGPSQYHGSAYGITPAVRGYLRPTGEWNHQEVYVKDDHIKVTLNGYPILDTRLKQVVPDHPAASTERGHLGLSGYSDPVWFRRIRLRELD